MPLVNLMLIGYTKDLGKLSRVIKVVNIIRVRILHLLLIEEASLIK